MNFFYTDKIVIRSYHALHQCLCPRPRAQRLFYGFSSFPLSKPKRSQTLRRRRPSNTTDTLDSSLSTSAPELSVPAVVLPYKSPVFLASDEHDFVVDSDDNVHHSEEEKKSLRPVPIDAIELVTDDFKEEREKMLKKRRQILYEMAHPNPFHYTFNGKLVPTPPVSFGTFSATSIALGNNFFVQPEFKLVKQASATDYFFEIHDLYIEVATVGMANAGKSSLINALLQQRVAKTSTIPNSTRTVNFYQAASQQALDNYARKNSHKLITLPGKGKQFTIVDIPGYGLPGMSDGWKDDAIQLTDQYLGLRRGLNTLLFCIDCDRGVTRTDVKYMEWLTNVKGTYFIVLTRCDRVSHTKLCAVMKTIYQLIASDACRNKKKYAGVYPFVLPVSSVTGENIDLLRALLVESSGIVPQDKIKTIMNQHDEMVRRAAMPRKDVKEHHLPRLPENFAVNGYSFMGESNEKKTLHNRGENNSSLVTTSPTIGGVSNFIENLEARPPSIRAAAWAVANHLSPSSPWAAGAQVGHMSDKEIQAYLRASGDKMIPTYDQEEGGFGRLTSSATSIDRLFTNYKIHKKMNRTAPAMFKRQIGQKEIHLSSSLKMKNMPHVQRYNRKEAAERNVRRHKETETKSPVQPLDVPRRGQVIGV